MKNEKRLVAFLMEKLYKSMTGYSDYSQGFYDMVMLEFEIENTIYGAMEANDEANKYNSECPKSGRVIKKSDGLGG